MPTVKEHYDQVLSDVYSWMFGGFDNGIERNTDFFKKHDIAPSHSGKALDLGAGCGFQSIPLAKAGFAVTALDIDAKLLRELAEHSRGLDITIVHDDLCNIDQHAAAKTELVVCMTDTLAHLDSKDYVTMLCNKVFALLEKGGRFIITFRDQSSALTELDRFIPVRSDDNTIFTCFLEYEPEIVKVHDIVYKKEHGAWRLYKSFYNKLRLSKDWVDAQLAAGGFTHIASTVENGCITIIATK